MMLRKKSFLSLLLAFIIAFSGAAVSFTQAMPAVNAEAASAKISKKKKTIYVGQVFELKIKNSKKDYVWKSSKPEVAMVVTGAGNRAQIGGFKPGKATITATNGKKKFKCKVTVKAQPEETEDSKDDKSDSSGNSGKDNKSDNSEVGGNTDKDDKSDSSGNAGKDDKSDGSENNGNTEKDTQSDNSGTEKDTGTNDPSVNNDSEKSDTSKPETISVPTLDEELASDTYGLLYPKQKTDYIPRTEYSGISTEDDLLKTMMNGVLTGTRGMVINFDSMNYNYWKNKYLVFINSSEMYNAANEFYIESEGSGTLLIFPIYKKAWFALTYYKYVRPGMDEDLKDYITPDEETLKILKMAHELAEDAVKAHPGDEAAILKYVNDNICDLTEYPHPVPEAKDDPARDVTGVFINHSAVCEGYTAAMQLVMNILGFENHTVKNKIDNHIWNRVKVDGTWYHIDATWNDVQDAAGNYADDWFMLTDDELDRKNGSSSSHAWNKVRFIP